MFIKIPFEKIIEFNTNISEITKISLEHDFNVNESLVLGNFYVNGEYRIHSVSINTNPFNYTLPFEVDIPDNIDSSTIEFNIEDFSYEIQEDNKLKVNIEYSLKGEELKEDRIFEKVNEDELESELAFIDDFLENEENKEEDENEDISKNEEEIKNVYQKEKISDDNKEDESESHKEERLDASDEKTIMDTIKSSDDTFVTYVVHIVKENETMESICKLYNVPSSLIDEYNGTEEFTIGDKIIIPKVDE